MFSFRHALATSPNKSYEMMKQGGHGGGQEGEHEYEVISPGGPPAVAAPQQPATASGGGGTEGVGDVVYENIPGNQ